MTIVKMNEYYERVSAFVNKHNINKVETSPFIENTWYKNYLADDGATGMEVNRVVYEKVEIEVKGLKCMVEVKLLETEWFDSDNGKSIYMYQRY